MQERRKERKKERVYFPHIHYKSGIIPKIILKKIVEAVFFHSYDEKS